MNPDRQDPPPEESEPGSWKRLLRGWNVLEKAQEDPFGYAVRIITGELFICTSAKSDHEWVHLDGITAYVAPSGLPDGVAALAGDRPFTFERGLDVKREHIVWMADAWGYESPAPLQD